ncbi:MAG TPA: acyl carrier protein [Pseudonocardia sp.]|nr:acyl carrier protein [Pseudonocardia sp.]
MSGAIEDEIRKIVGELLSLDPAVVDASTPFDEFGMSSTMRVRLLATVETRFDVLVDTDEVDRLVDLRGAAAVVSEALARRQAEPG